MCMYDRGLRWAYWLMAVFVLPQVFSHDVNGQDDRFDSSYIPADTSILMTMNVSRLLADGREWESKKLIDFLLDGNLDANEIDQFQVIAGSGEEMSEGTGGDATAHLKLVFREPIEMSSDRLSKITGSSLRESEEHKGNIWIPGKRDNNWGGFQSNKNTVIIAVNERAESLMDSKPEEGPILREFAQVDRDCDLFLAVRRGPETGFFFMQMFGMNPEQDELAFLEYGEIRFKVDDNRPVWGKLRYADEEVAEVAEASLTKFLGGMGDMFLSASDAPRRGADDKVAKELEALEKFVKLAQSMEIKRDGDLIEFELTVSDDIEEVADQVFGVMLKSFGHPSLSRQ